MGGSEVDYEMNYILAILGGLISGVLGALGMGGGGVLIIYLTVFACVDQMTAQGINLLFFIPCAIVAVIIHTKNKLIKWKAVLPIILGGIPGVVLGSFLAGKFGSDMLSKIFGGLLILLGIKELFFSPKKKAKSD